MIKNRTAYSLKAEYVNYDEFEKFKWDIFKCRDFPIPMAVHLQYEFDEFGEYLKDLKENYPKIYQMLIEARREYKSHESNPKKQFEVEKKNLAEFVKVHPEYESIVNWDYM